MTKIVAGASDTVTVPQGSKLKTTGIGIAVRGPGSRANQPTVVRDTASFGPYQHDQVFYLTATTDMNYVVEANISALPVVHASVDADNAFTSLAGPDGSVLYGSVTSGAWMKVPTVFRLRLTGTGTCVIDSRNRLGVVSTAFASFSPSGATNQIEYPYPGDDAVEIRATLTGTCKAEVL